MRKYYLSAIVQCDKCGCEDTLDNQTETEGQLEPHIERYYKKHEDKDLCLDCYTEVVKEE